MPGPNSSSTSTLARGHDSFSPPQNSFPSSSSSPPSLSEVEFEAIRQFEAPKIMMDEPIEVRASRYSKKQKLWKHTTNGARTVTAEPLPSSVRILTWNIDFSQPNTKTRLKCILDHVQQTVFECKSGERPPPCCILLQEVHQDAFRVILSHQWVKDHFVVAPSARHHWPNGATYGLVTLVARTLPVTSINSIAFNNSIMTRNALFVDVKLSLPAPFPRKQVTLRVGSTHLESLPLGEAARRGQMRLIAEFLKEEGLHGAVVGGDMNAISISDDQLPKRNGLVDAWKSGDVEVGMTWGFQPPQWKLPVGRLDKVHGSYRFWLLKNWIRLHTSLSAVDVVWTLRVHVMHSCFWSAKSADT